MKQKIHKKMGNQRIQLTEQDLHFLVEDAVRNYLIQEGMDEGFWGGLSSLGSRFGNKAARAGQNMADTVGQGMNKAGQAIGGAYNNAKNAVGQAANRAGQAIGGAYNNAKDAVGGAYNNAKNTWQTGSANQDAQNAIQNAVKALNALKSADQKLQSLGQYSVIGKQSALIDQLIAALNQGGSKSISGRFQNRRNAFTN